MKCPVEGQDSRTRQTAGRETASSGRQLSTGQQGAQTRKVSENPDFGEIPSSQKLQPLGHGKIDLAVRWITRQPDGLYLQSRYGILRLSPIGSAIIRVTFTKNGQPDSAVHPGIAVNRTEKFWMYKDLGNAIELNTDELTLQIQKSTGAIRYMAVGEKSRDRKLLLAEHSTPCRQLENTAGGKQQIRLYLDWAKDERLYSPGLLCASKPNRCSGTERPAANQRQSMEQHGHGGSGNTFDPVSQQKTAGPALLSLRGGAYYISHSGEAELPFLFSDKGYGLLLATDSPVFCCDLPAQGSYLHTESQNQMDYYFIAGKRQDNLQNAYRYLCGKL